MADMPPLPHTDLGRLTDGTIVYVRQDATRHYGEPHRAIQGAYITLMQPEAGGYDGCALIPAKSMVLRIANVDELAQLARVFTDLLVAFERAKEGRHG